MMKKVVAVTLVSIIALSASACKEEELPSAEEIINRAISALDDLETYQFDAEMTMEMTIEAEGETGRFTAGAECSGAMDVTNSEMMIDMNIDMAGTGEFGEDMNITARMEMYLVDDTMYAKIDMPFPLNGGLGSGWVKFKIPEDLREQITTSNQMESLTEMLELVEFEVTGTQKIDGAACYVLEFTPDPDALWELIVRQIQQTVEEEPEDTELEFLRNMLDTIADGISVKLWISKDTYFLTRVEYDIALDIAPEDLGMPEEEGKVTADMAMSFDIYEINEPVSIELPPEAEDAVEMPLDDMSW